MTAVVDQVKNVAYTSVGVNLIISDAVANSIREQRPEFAERFEGQAEKLFSSVKINVPGFVEEHADIARRHGAQALIKFHDGSQGRVARLEKRLPARVGEAMSERRRAAWNFLNVEGSASNDSSPNKDSSNDSASNDSSPNDSSPNKDSSKKTAKTEEI